MATSKNARVLQASATNAAGATTLSATPLNLATALGGVATLIITNGATGPTVACTGSLEYSRDGTQWHEFYSMLAGVTANGVYPSPPIEIPFGIMNLRSKFTGNTVQGVTIEAYLEELTTA